MHIGLSRQEVEHVQALIAELDSAPAAPGADRRLRPRIDFAHPMWLHMPLEAGRPWVHVYSRNLSTGGLAFLSRQAFAAGAYVIMAHHFNEGVDQLALSRIKFCREVETGFFEIGLEFQQVAADPEHRREIPGGWLTMVLRSLWVARCESLETDNVITPL